MTNKNDKEIVKILGHRVQDLISDFNGCISDKSLETECVDILSSAYDELSALTLTRQSGMPQMEGTQEALGNLSIRGENEI